MLYEFTFSTEIEAQRVRHYYDKFRSGIAPSTVSTWLDEIDGTWILIVNRIPDSDEPLHTRPASSYRGRPGRRRGDAT